MPDTYHFAALVAAVAGTGLLAVLAQRLTDLVRIPAPVVFLAVAAVAARVIRPLHAPALPTVENLVTVALVVILFDGGLQLGWRRVRAVGPAVLAVGILGTVVTAGAVATLLHGAFSIPWYAALLVGTALAPTDPAVVFSVLGRRELVGPSGAILEGESGANDPVGIALMLSLISAGRLDGSTAAHVLGRFALQMGVGAAVGLAAGWVLLQSLRRVSLPAESLYSLFLLAGIQLVYAAATLARGSGFLAVFVVGIALADARAPYRQQIRRFHAALASLGEIVAFVVLGLTVDLDRLGHADVLVPGLVVGVALAVAIRPLAVGLCLLGSGLRPGERTFVALVGLKGAVPILLGILLLASGIAAGPRYYAIIVVVVVVSVAGQGSLVPAAAAALGVPTRPTVRDESGDGRTVEPQRGT